jgi:hypothetical protein
LAILDRHVLRFEIASSEPPARRLPTDRVELCRVEVLSRTRYPEGRVLLGVREALGLGVTTGSPLQTETRAL